MTNLKDVLWIAGAVLGIVGTVSSFGYFLFKAGAQDAMKRNGYVSDARFKETIAQMVSRDVCHGHVTHIEETLFDVKETQTKLFGKTDELMKGIARIEGRLEARS